eukprot:200079_1
MNPPWSFCLAQHINQRTKDMVAGFNKNILMTKEVPAIVNCICLCYFYGEKLHKVNVQKKRKYADFEYVKTNETCHVLHQHNNYNYISRACGLIEINCHRIKNHTIQWKFGLDSSIAIIGLVSTPIKRHGRKKDGNHQFFGYKSSNGVTLNGEDSPNTSAFSPKKDRIVHKNDTVRMLFQTNKNLLTYYQNESTTPFMKMHISTKYDCTFTLWAEVHISGSIELLSFRITPSNGN